MRLRTLTALYDGDSAMRDACAVMLEIEHNLPSGFLKRTVPTTLETGGTAPVKPSQGESNPAGAGTVPVPASADSVTSDSEPEAAPTAESEPAAAVPPRSEGSAPAVSPSQPPANPITAGKTAPPHGRAPAGLTAQKRPDPGEDRPPETVRDLPEEARPRNAMPPPPEPAEQRGFVTTLPVKTGYRREWKRTFRPGPLSGL